MRPRLTGPLALAHTAAAAATAALAVGCGAASGAPPIRPVATPSANMPPSSDAASAPGIVELHIESDAPITRLMGAETCVEPCDRVIDGRRGRRFYFAPSDAPESDRFDLQRWSGPVTARVSAGSDLRQKGGYVIIGLGGFAVINGLEGVLTGAVVRGFAHEDETKDLGKTFQVVGLVTMAVGAVIGLGGLGLATTGDTTYQLSPAPRSGISQRSSAAR